MYNFEIDGIKYRMNPKQYKALHILIRKDNYNHTDFSVENNLTEYKRIISKHQLLPLDIENDR